MENLIIQGCMRFANKTKEQVYEIIQENIRNGFNYFDHADIYGNGQCEKIFGEVLLDHPELRSQIIIQSKCGIVIDKDGKKTFDSSKEYIINHVEQSLERLHTDYLDYLLIHRPDIFMNPQEIAEAFDYLEKSGKVKHFGVSNFNIHQLKYLQKYVHQKIEINQLQLSICHTLLVDQEFYVNMDVKENVGDNNALYHYCLDNGIIIQAWSPIQYGFFEGIFIDDYDRFPELNHKMDELCTKYNCSKNALAIAFILKIPGKIQVINGSTSKEHIVSSFKAIDIDLTNLEWYQIYASAGHLLP